MVNMNTAISWTNSTWSPVVGCTKVSSGCDHCYAKTLVDRGFLGQKFEEVRMHENRLVQVNKFYSITEPDGSLSPRLVFTNSMSDAFHSEIPDAFVHKMLDAMESTPSVIYQTLTKRPVRAREILAARYGNSGIPSNMWFGVSVESNDVGGRLNILRRIKDQTGGSMTAFASVEPIIGPTDKLNFTGIDWAIFGGESGGHARIMRPEWLLEGIARAQETNAAIFLKQHGQPRSHPLWHLPPKHLGIKARFQWLIDEGLEVLPNEKGGATLAGKVTHREFPAHYHKLKAELNHRRATAELF